jgi:hypothetical protein
MKTDGWKSRKLWLSVLAMGLILAGYVLCGHPDSAFGTFCTAILAAKGMHSVANLTEKLKTPAAPPAPPAAP